MKKKEGCIKSKLYFLFNGSEIKGKNHVICNTPYCCERDVERTFKHNCHICSFRNGINSSEKDEIEWITFP